MLIRFEFLYQLRFSHRTVNEQLFGRNLLRLTSAVDQYRLWYGFSIPAVETSRRIPRVLSGLSAMPTEPRVIEKGEPQ